MTVPLTATTCTRHRLRKFATAGVGFALATALARRLRPQLRLRVEWRLRRHRGEHIHPEPRLATEWNRVDDKTWGGFTLREGVTFHDGTPLTVDNVVFSFNEIIAKSFVTASILSTVDTVTAVDESTVRITTKTPDALLLNSVAQVPIVPKAHYESLGPEGFAAAPVGTGPYTLDNIDINTGVTLHAYDGFWGDAPETENIDLRYFSDPNSLASALESGQVDVAHSLAVQSLKTISSNPDFTLWSGFSGSQNMMQFKSHSGPFADERVREAANLAVDVDALIESQTYGEGLREDGQLAIEGILGYTDEISRPAHDSERAKQLLAEAGAEGASIKIAGLGMYKSLLEAVGALPDVVTDIAEIRGAADPVAEATAAYRFSGASARWAGSVRPSGAASCWSHSPCPSTQRWRTGSPVPSPATGTTSTTAPRAAGTGTSTRGFVHHELVYHHLLTKLYGGSGDIFTQRAAFARSAPADSYGSIVDLDCGTGQYTLKIADEYPEASIVGVDLSRAELVYAARRAEDAGVGITFRRAAAEDTGLPASSADLVTSFILLHELPPHAVKAVFAEAFRLLRPGGHVHFADEGAYSRRTPYHAWKDDWLAEHGNEPWWRTSATLDLAQVAREAGFVDVRQFELAPGFHPMATTARKP